ncbi:J domain-containing protein [Peteryoungia desertarenae]|uniref:J domain-containing protein n=1 Tax=Peteryoungia desertarenae TaxID=1813451 RepID=A0ABX6QME2_9HYPH|nr:DnaJ domain-containing protein [Peteryoungia desertarenae]QLF69642.1 J domain-containing protein [Peteryoungia desertarenae]
MRDFYSILGVKRDAGADEIKAAWRTKAKTVHPDQNRDDPEAHNRFAEIGRAYETLKDPQKRSRYDSQRAKVEALEREQTIMQQRQAAREAAEKAKIAKANAERIMAELAKAEAERLKAEQAAAAASAAKAAADKATADKAKAAASATQEKKSSSAQDSAQTDSKGKADASQGGANGSTSSQAKGGGPSSASGSTEDVVNRIFGDTPEAAAAAESLKREQDARTDDHSLGDGLVPRPGPSILAPIELFSFFVRRLRGVEPPPEKAPDVFAEATVSIADLLEQKTVPITLSDGRELRVPLSGATEGHVVRLKGQGLKIQGMVRGDVAVTVRVSRSERFVVDGYDIRTVLPITLENAVLGCETEVEGPEGKVALTVPTWANSDQTIRIDDMGLPNGEGGRGALVVELRVMLWEKPDEKVTDLMRVMREGLYL